MNPDNSTDKLTELTERQREVLSLYCEGLDYKTIGEQLYITRNAVKSHMGNIYLRLGLIELPIAQRKQRLHQEVIQHHPQPPQKCILAEGFLPDLTPLL